MKTFLVTLLSMISWASFAQDVKPITADELQAADTKDWIILDVRTEEEFNEGHVPGAVNVPLGRLEVDSGKLKDHKDTPIVVYCRSGRRAGLAADILLQRDFSNLMHLQGDMLGWKKAGRPVDK